MRDGVYERASDKWRKKGVHTSIDHIGSLSVPTVAEGLNMISAPLTAYI